MQHHQIIHDLEQVKRFAELFVPHQTHHAIVISLIARRKYDANLEKPAYILQRIFINGESKLGKKLDRVKSSNHLCRYLLRLESPFGSYVYGDDDRPIPDKSLAVYAHLDEKDTVKALSSALQVCVDRMLNKEEVGNAFNLYKEHIVKNNVTISDGLLKYRQLDIDTKDPEKIDLVKKIVSDAKLKMIMAVETRGGYHIIFENGGSVNYKALYEFKKKTLEEKIDAKGQKTKDHWFSITNSPMMIIPGTYQGGFKTRIVDIFFANADT